MSNKIETDFTELAKQINEKIKEASQAMKEAHKLAKDAGIPLLNLDEYAYDEYSKEEIEKMDSLVDKIRISRLFDVLDESGWHTSSIEC